jgi:hypothetical protein
MANNVVTQEQAFDPAEFDTPAVGTGPEEMGQGFDPSEFDTPALSQFADGASPDTAINKSPVDAMDRLRYAAGNKAGVLKDLKKKFEDVQTDSHGNFVVKKDGMWHKVDPKGLGDTDPWDSMEHIVNNIATMGKEAVGDIADNAAKVASGAVTGAIYGTGMGGPWGAAAGAVIGAAMPFLGDGIERGVDAIKDSKVGAAVLGTGGLFVLSAGLRGLTKTKDILTKANVGAILASGAVEGARSTMGRLTDTYEGDWDQQVKDAAVESLLNLGGVAVAAGAKPTATSIVSGLKKAGQTFLNAPEETKQLTAAVIGKTSGAGYGNTYTYLTDPDGVTRMMTQASQGGKASGDSTIQTLHRQNISDIKFIAESADDAVNKIYGNMRQSLLSEEVLPTGRGLKDVVLQDQMNAVQNGFARFLKPELDENGKTFTKILKTEDVLKLINENNGQLPKDVKFDVKTLGRLIAEQRRTGNISEVANSEEAHTEIARMLGTLKRLGSIKQKDGQDGVKQILDYYKVVSDNHYRMRKIGLDEKLPALTRFAANMHENTKSTVSAMFDKGDGVNPFLQMNEQFSTAKDALIDVTKAVRLAESSADKPYHGLLKAISDSRPTASVSAKDGIAAAVRISNEAGMPQVGQAYNRILQRESAKAFSVWAQPKTVALAVGAGSAGGSAAMFHGSPMLAVGLAAAGAATSPVANRTAMNVGLSLAGAARGVGQSEIGQGIGKIVGGATNKVANSMPARLSAETWQSAKEFTTQLALSGKVQQFTQNPALVKQFFSTVVGNSDRARGLTDQLVGHAVDATNPPPPIPMQTEQGGK